MFVQNVIKKPYKLLTTLLLCGILLSVGNSFEGLLVRKHLAIYGCVKLQRVYCEQCKGNTLVVGGLKQCCETPVEKVPTKAKKNMIESNQSRKKPSFKRQAEISKLQDNKCFYCNKEFGTPYFYEGKVRYTVLHWDHLIPYSYCKQNKDFVAACNICNSLKGNLIFDTVEEAFYYVEHRRKKKGYTYYEDLSSMQEEIST